MVMEQAQLTVMEQAEGNNASSSKKIVLVTSDGQEIEVAMASASLCKIIHRSLEDCDDDVLEESIQLSNVHSNTIGKVFEYCNKHATDDGSAQPEPLKAWDGEYVKDLVADPFPGLELLRRVLLAAHYLEIDGLLSLLVKATADLIKTKSPSEIRRVFKIEKDFTPEQAAEVRKKHGWAAEEEWATEEEE